MARCYPDFVYGRSDSHVESKFLRRLQEELSDDYVVIPSLERAASGGHTDSEADFIVLHPRGWLLLEMKGGGWRRLMGKWERYDSKAKRWVSERKCPFQQARGNCYSLHKSVEGGFLKDSNEAKSLFGRAVIFPDLEANFSTGEFPGEMFLDQRTLLTENGLEKACERLFDFSESQYRLRKQGKERSDAQKKEDVEAKAQRREPITVEPKSLETYMIPERLTPEQVMAVAKVLRPDIKPVFNLSVDDVNRALIRFSASQLRVLDAVERSKRLRIIGGPGSGKTLLAFESIRRELRERPDAKVAMICFNRSLGGFLAEVAKSEALKGVVVGSFYVHVDSILGSEGVAKGDAAYFEERVQATLAKAVTLTEDQKFDLIVVDEGQDFRDDADKLALMSAMLKGGLAKGRWRWFEDLNQVLTPAVIGPTDERLVSMNEILDEAAEVAVNGNWRNTEEIAACACTALGVTYEEDDVGLHGPPVQSGVVQAGRELDLLAVVLEKIISKEISEGHYQTEDIILLSMRGSNKACFEGLTSLGGFALEPYDVSQPAKPGVIRTSSVFKFKGMESHSVILVDMDSLEELRERRKAYVGLTRARYQLFVLGSDNAIRPLFTKK
jgi:hypothetical protein